MSWTWGKTKVDPELVVPNPKLTLAEGAIVPWSKPQIHLVGIIISSMLLLKLMVFFYECSIFKNYLIK